MKNRFQVVTIFLLLTAAVMSCGGNDDPTVPEETPQEIAEALFIGSWGLSNGSITLGGVDVSDDYQGFTLSISNGTYSTTNAGELFPASGTWSWVGESDAQVTTGSGKQITLRTLTTTSLVFSFEKTNSNSIEGLPGDYVITLSK